MEQLSVDRVEFRIFAALCAVLVLKQILLGFGTGTVRGIFKGFTLPEDVKFFGGDGQPQDRIVRINKVQANNTENEPWFMAIGLLFLLVGAGESAIQWYGYTFVLARIVHNATYLLGLPIVRSLAYAVGGFASIGMSVQVLMAAFR